MSEIAAETEFLTAIDFKNLPFRSMLLCSLLVLVIGVRTSASPVPQDSETKNIVVLHTYNSNNLFNRIWSEAFREIVGADVRYQVYEEFFDYDRLPLQDEVLVRSLQQKYAGHKMDLVVASGRIPMGFLKRHGEELWPGAVHIYAGADSRIARSRLPPGSTGVFGKVDFGATVELALRLLPDTQHVYYVGGTDPAEDTWRQLLADEFRRFADKVQITYLNDLPLPELLDQLGRLPDHSVVIYPGLFRDASGHSYAPDRVCSLVTSASNAPVFSTFNVYVGRGIVGGVVFDTKAFAEETARMALRAIEKGSAAGVPVELISPNVTVVDWRQLRKWNIPEDRLPPNAIVLSREPTLWQRYRLYLFIAIAILIVQLGLIVALIIQRRLRANSEEAVRRLNGRLINAAEEERKRLARELHDDIGQRLSLVSIELDLMKQTSGLNGSSLNPTLQQLDEIISDIHGLSHRLHSTRLQVLGLEAALRDLCQQLQKQFNLRIDFSATNLPSLQSDLALCFYRVAQEGLSNCVKHSGATNVQVCLTFKGGSLRLSIKDDGSGFDLTRSTSSLGLATMRERLRFVGGELNIVSGQGVGTELTAEARIEAPSLKVPA